MEDFIGLIGGVDSEQTGETPIANFRTRGKLEKLFSLCYTAFGSCSLL